ncbi:MAG: spore germination protein GerW family protein [Methanothrix sp.]|nr:spore germination protein GerW family protein [Methanothrix sp.]
MTGIDAKKATLDELLDALSAQSIMSEPIEMEDKIIIPVTKMGMGFGTDLGRTDRDGSHEGPARCGAGGGIGIYPVAVVVVFKGICGPEGVKVINMAAINVE